ncbi:hypothetical protein [Janthinobacterium sp. JC611]|uniref:hypothetical protein n=1 Tax=Janthinobacterium sp. JC611 TaxID=2816201 RepID=UPI001BFDE68E|nr:hypothetical protein [Janthinobacterium sp. JC611]
MAFDNISCLAVSLPILAKNAIYHGDFRKLPKQKTANPPDNCALKVAIRAMISLGESQHGQPRRVFGRPAFLDIQQ